MAPGLHVHRSSPRIHPHAADRFTSEFRLFVRFDLPPGLRCRTVECSASPPWSPLTPYCHHRGLRRLLAGRRNQPSRGVVAPWWCRPVRDRRCRPLVGVVALAAIPRPAAKNGAGPRSPLVAILTSPQRFPSLHIAARSRDRAAMMVKSLPVSTFLCRSVMAHAPFSLEATSPLVASRRTNGRFRAQWRDLARSMRTIDRHEQEPGFSPLPILPLQRRISPQIRINSTAKTPWIRARSSS